MPRQKLSADNLLERITTIKVFQTLIENDRCGFSVLYESVKDDMRQSTLYVHLGILKDYIFHDAEANEFYLHPLRIDEVVSIVNTSKLKNRLPKLKWKDNIGVAYFDPDTISYVDLINEYTELTNKLKRNAKRMRRIWVGQTLFNYRRFIEGVLKTNKHKDDQLLALGYFYYHFKQWTKLHDISNLKFCKEFEKQVFTLADKEIIKNEAINWEKLESHLDNGDVRNVTAKISHEEGGIPYHIAYEIAIERGEIKGKSIELFELLERQDVINKVICRSKKHKHLDPYEPLLPLTGPQIIVDCSASY